MFGLSSSSSRRRKWQPTPVFLPGESQGRGASWAVVYGVTQSRTRLNDLAAQQQQHPLLSQAPKVWASVQFSSVAQSCLTLCNLMNHSTPGLPVHHQLQESIQTHVHQVGDAIQPSHPLLSPSPPALNPSQH